MWKYTSNYRNNNTSALFRFMYGKFKKPKILFNMNTNSDYKFLIYLFINHSIKFFDSTFFFSAIFKNVVKNYIRSIMVQMPIKSILNNFQNISHSYYSIANNCVMLIHIPDIQKIIHSREEKKKYPSNHRSFWSIRHIENFLSTKILSTRSWNFSDVKDYPFE